MDKIHTTAESHHRIMVVEVMGRDAGWIALESGIAGGAHVILIPEIKFTIANICKFVEQRETSGKRFTIVVVAEGISMPTDLDVYHGNERRANSRPAAPATLSAMPSDTSPSGKCASPCSDTSNAAAHPRLLTESSVPASASPRWT